jgi:twin BRCT domain
LLHFRKQILNNLNNPFLVSPLWVEAACIKREIFNSKLYPPTYKTIPEPKSSIDHYLTRHSSNDGTTTTTTNTIRATSLFRGSVFVLVRVTPPEWSVDYDSNVLEQSIRANGGQMMSIKLLDAIKSDHERNKNQRDPGHSKVESTDKRSCYVIVWGENDPSHINLNPLVASIKRHQLCHVDEVTPIWLQTCITEQKVLSSAGFPKVFKPQGPLHYLPKQKQLQQENKHNNQTIRISITGFSGSKRTAIIHLIHAIGATYDDSMKMSTTHLICREHSGAKYEKAIECKTIHITRLEWLYHIALHGYHGIDSKNSTE